MQRYCILALIRGPSIPTIKPLTIVEFDKERASIIKNIPHVLTLQYMAFYFYSIRKTVSYRNEVYRYTKQFKKIRSFYSK